MAKSAPKKIQAGKATLRAWFAQRMAAAYGDGLQALPPEKLLRRLGAPESIFELLSLLEADSASHDPDAAAASLIDRQKSVSILDLEFSLKQCADGQVPDLESREKKRKRSTGQFYTPEILAQQIAALVDYRSTMTVLDPACGDGSFLLAMAARMAQENGGLQSAEPRRGFLSDLHGFDIDATALFVCLVRLVTLFPGCGWPQLERRDFLLQPVAATFDLVIGNPPYRVNLESEYKQRLLELYVTAEGEKDLYTFFIEAGLKTLIAGGQLVMLTSHTYLVNHQCGKIRSMVFAQNQVEKILLLPERFFVMAPGILPVVTILRRQPPSNCQQLVVAADYAAASGWQKQFMASAAGFIDGRGLRQAIVSPRLAAVFAQMTDNCERLGERCRVGVGIQESQKRGGVISRFVSDECSSERHRPVLRGRELAAFAINWEGRFIDYGPHLAFAGDEKVFAAGKVLYQNIRNEKLRQRLVAAFDRRGFFPKNSLSYIVPDAETLSGDFLSGILNSSLVNAWFSGNFHSFHITVTQVRQIPLPIYAKAAWERVAKSASALADLAAGHPDWQQKLQQLEESVFECYLGAGDHAELLLMCDNFLDQAARL